MRTEAPSEQERQADALPLLRRSTRPRRLALRQRCMTCCQGHVRYIRCRVRHRARYNLWRDLPDRRGLRKPVESFGEKYSAWSIAKITLTLRVIPHLQEGRLAIVTDVGSGMRWTQSAEAQSLRGRAALMRTAKSCGSGAPTLALSRWYDPSMTVAKEPGHREEHEGPR
jgi:hypothetical protein